MPIPELLTESHFQTMNVSDIVGQMSPEAMSLALNSGVAVVYSGAGLLATTPPINAGVIRVPMPQRKCRVELRIGRPFATGEAILPIIRWLDTAGNEQAFSLDSGVLSSTELAAKGVYDMGTYELPHLAAGTIYAVEWNYEVGTSGGNGTMVMGLEMH